MAYDNAGFFCKNVKLLHANIVLIIPLPFKQIARVRAREVLMIFFKTLPAHT